MFSTFAFLMFVVAGSAGLVVMAVRDHRAVKAARSCLLDEIAERLENSTLSVGPDGFPTLSGRLPDQRAVAVELLCDTLVTRRLPQLWLIVTIRQPVEGLNGSVGALARPTGAEFYALTHSLPERIEAPPGLDAAILVRGNGGLSARQIAGAGAAFSRIFADPTVKEAAATPRFLRIVRQASEGDRGAHLVLRQVRFPTAPLGYDLVLRAVADADELGAALASPARLPAKLSA